MLRPDVGVTAIEANLKESIFLKEAKDELGLSNFRVVSMRFEEFDWSGYDVVTSRALEGGFEIWASVIARLARGQRLMLYTTAEVLAVLTDRAGSILEAADRGVQTHPIPHSESRLIAVFDQ